MKERNEHRKDPGTEVDSTPVLKHGLRSLRPFLPWSSSLTPMTLGQGSRHLSASLKSKQESKLLFIAWQTDYFNESFSNLFVQMSGFLH